MYNLLMRSSSDHNVWQANQGVTVNANFLRRRIFEYTDEHIKQRFSSLGTPDFQSLMELPCLFTYEGSDGAGAIGRITDVRYEDRIFEITYTLPALYPTIRINNDAAFEGLGIEVGRWSERSRTHWAVKDVDLFDATIRLLHNVGNVPVVLSAEEMRNVWGNDYNSKRLAFLSHSARYSRQVAEVKTRLEQRGLSCFLADRDITPSTIWQDQILNALDTMDIFIGFVTDDFHGGGWTDQEIGYAVQRGVFRVFVKLEQQYPVGMVWREQALKAGWDKVAEEITAHLRRMGELYR